MTAATLRSAIIVCLAVLFGSGCTEQPAPSLGTPQDPAFSATETSKDFGDYVVHFNALSTEDLNPAIAQQYGIVRSRNRALLNVTILKKEPTGEEVPISGSVAATAINLTGQLKNLTFREIKEGSAIYYLGEVAISHEETLIFSIDVTPINEASRFSVRYKRQFFID